MTDAFGAFRLVVSKRAFVQEVNYGRLLFRDPKGGYKDKQEAVNLGDLHTIEMEKGKNEVKRFNVGGFIGVTFDAREGSLVTIKAGGNIRVGAFVGNSGPEGRESGVLNMSLEGYNIIPRYNHAALMYRLEGSLQWAYCGAECQFITQKAGAQKIFFEINDNQQSDNSGTYHVELSVED